MSTLDRGAVRLHYERGGSGLPVLLTHGFSATGDMWNPQREPLEAEYQLTTWDLRGHGRTECPFDQRLYTHAQAVADMAALLDEAGAEQAVVGGLSLGGFLSLAFYAAHPERVRALILCDTGPGYRKDEARGAWNDTAHRWADDFEERGLEALRGRSREMQEAASLHGSAQGLALAARGLLAQFDSTVIDVLPEIAVPTLIVVGSEDKPYLAPCEYMASKIPNARHEVVADAGHSVNLDQPEVVNELFLDFLGSL
ncbi:MAG: alpha/beta fold hydrolase [Acidobacteriota bacterium]